MTRAPLLPPPGRAVQSSLSGALLLFLKYPEMGKVKTRLARTLGPQEALRIYRQLLCRTLGLARDFQFSHPLVHLILYVDPPEKVADMQRNFPGPWTIRGQDHGDLGKRMASAFRETFAMGCQQVVLVGVDLADLKLGDLKKGFEALCRCPVVLGPARDGGYYLIGLRHPMDSLFQGIPWSTPRVWEVTLHRLESRGVVPGVLDVRRDVDEGADLAFLKAQPFFDRRISVIVPCIGPLSRLAPLVDALQQGLWSEDEILLVRGQNHAATPVELCQQGVRHLVAPKGRGIQMNLGALRAEGDLFWFLHADSSPPPDPGYHVRTLLEHPGASLGCFQLGFQEETPGLRLLSRWANFRTRVFKLPYGDQGLFCSRRVFEKVGGFQRSFLMEDVTLVRACRQLGSLLIIPRFIHSSPERYQRRGILPAGIQNHFLMLLHLAGVSDALLYRIYYRKRP